MRSSPQVAIVHGHFGDQLLQVGRNTRPAARPRFPFPKKTESFAMPTNQSVRSDDREGILPVKEAESRASVKRIELVARARLRLSLHVRAVCVKRGSRQRQRRAGGGRDERTSRCPSIRGKCSRSRSRLPKKSKPRMTSRDSTK